MLAERTTCGRIPRRQTRGGFTLIEVLVATSLTAVAIVAALGGIRALDQTDAKAHEALILRRLAVEKVNDLRILPDPSQAGGGGDFTDRGITDVTWSADVEPTSVSNLDQVTVTVTKGKDSQEVTTLIYVPTSTGTTTGAAAPAPAAGGGG